MSEINHLHGYLLSDSLMRGITEVDQQMLVSFLKIGSLKCESYGGYTLEDLIGPSGIAHKYLSCNPSQVVILGGGTNNLGKFCGSPQRMAEKLALTFHDLLGAFTQTYPDIQVIVLPIPKRKLAVQFNARHPENSDPVFIDKVNEALRIFQTKARWLSLPNVKFCESPSQRVWETHVVNDGVHLYKSGQRIMTNMVLSIGTPPNFESKLESDEEFPALKPVPIGEFNPFRKIPVLPFQPKLIACPSPKFSGKVLNISESSAAVLSEPLIPKIGISSVKKQRVGNGNNPRCKVQNVPKVKVNPVKRHISASGVGSRVESKSSPSSSFPASSGPTPSSSSNCSSFPSSPPCPPQIHGCSKTDSKFDDTYFLSTAKFSPWTII